MALKTRRKQKVPAETVPAQSLRERPPERVSRLPEVERSFFTLLLRQLYAGLQDLEQMLKRPEAKSSREEQLHKSGRIRATTAYALALLRLEDLRNGQPQPETLDLLSLLNIAVNALRRDFLFAGVSVRRPPSIAPVEVRVPKETFLFLLEEMLGCCLRCAPHGKNLHIGLREIPGALLLSMRTEGEAVQHTPLMPLPGAKDEEDEEEEPSEGGTADYGFAVSSMLANRLGCRLRWETDGAGVRLFLEIPM